MNKIKLIIIGIVILFVASLVITINVQIKKINSLELDNLRLGYNQNQLNDTITNLTVLTLTQKETIGKYAQQRDSALKALHLKPKQVLKIITNTITETIHDTIPVPVNIVTDNVWKITDTGKCFVYKADILLLDDSLSVYRTDFIYQNKTTEVFFKVRPHKFLFIRWGKWDYKRDISSECGQSKVEDITFIK